MDIKLVALDLDGTLLNSQKEISEANKEALAKAHAQGVKIVITTGRPLSVVTPFLEELDLIHEDDYAITFNGGLIQRNTGEILDEVIFGYEEVKAIYDLTRDLGLSLDLVLGNDVYALASAVPSLYPTCNKSLNHMPTTFDQISPEMTFNKAVSCCEAEVIDRSLPDISEDYHQRFEIFKSRDIILEWSPKGVHKANGLSSLCRFLGIDQSQVMACGDEANDLSMIEWAGVGVAVANATDEIKEAAAIVSPLTNDQDAIASIIYQYVLEKE